MELVMIVFSLVTVLIREGTHAAQDNLYCYHWTQEDIAAMGPERSLNAQREQCESNPGRVFTQGNNEDYPNCGTCWCCQRKVQDNFYCYHWTQEDLAAMGPERSLNAQRELCESHPERVFTQGNNADNPICGTCWCCQRKCTFLRLIIFSKISSNFVQHFTFDLNVF
ncbi:uncharacterized protein LOC123538671 [Mercenaria mercenaria]|uniref:uncharacterized protein LOC123538671 n=1 Tax=Mercenaria mercenaria TaxID=6596 RepID=UPI00234F6B62|nr:uncharacterized protein LOC123538671 [Mercenaria mercenaria]